MEQQQPLAENGGHFEAFTFGDPAPVIDGLGWMEYLSCVNNGKWFEPPISPGGLAKSLRSAVHHESAIWFKTNVLASCFKATTMFSRADFRQLVLDYLVMGNCYVEQVQNLRNRSMAYRPALAKFTRRGVDLESFWFIPRFDQEHEFKNQVFHVREVDIDQEIYGVPQYMSALQSAFLNENATLFRRKYYLNGSHAGFILYMTDTAHNEQDIGSLRAALKESKGPGNFRNLFMYAPGGKKDGMQLIPISEVAAKDEFNGIKEVTRDDMLAAHRIPPALMGIVPKNSSGFGSIEQAASVFARNELRPLMSRFEEINEMAGDSVIEFDPYRIESAVVDATGG